MRKLWMLLMLLCLTAMPVLAEEALIVKADGADLIELMWDDRIAWYTRQSDGEWTLSGLQDYGADTWYVDAWCGLYEYGTGQFIVGNTAVPLTDGPTGDALFDLLENPDRTGWAVVSAPGSAAPLYTAPDEASTVQGRFFTGAPVRVLEEGTAWCRVSIGAEDVLSGWMCREALAFGEAIAAVAAEFPHFGLSEETWEYMPPEGPYIAIGEKDGQLILLVELERLMMVTPNAREPETFRFPVEGKVLDYAQTNIHGVEVLLVIAEDGDSRRLWVCETDAQGKETLRKTKPLPWDVELAAADKPYDLHELTLHWNDGKCQATFDRRPDGEWLLSGFGYRDEGFFVSTGVAFCGLLTGVGKPVPCSFNGLEESLFSNDLEMLFERADTINCIGWAVVESFFAEVYPDKETAENGREYAFRLWQGTPLRILKVEGGMCHVELGDGSGLTGWVYASRLAVEDEIDRAALLPDLCVMDDAVITSDGTIDLRVALEHIWPVGETADGAQAIILLPDGSVGYCPSSAVHHGNG